MRSVAGPERGRGSGGPGHFQSSCKILLGSGKQPSQNARDIPRLIRVL